MKKKPTLDEHLAAPDSVRNNEKEMAKLLERNLRDEARLKRERWHKKKGKPTLEDILADIVEVAESEEKNPRGHQQRSINRRRYELHGQYMIEDVLEHGTFGHLKSMAKLQPSTADRRLLLKRTKDSLLAHDHRYFDRYIAPYVDLYPELTRVTQKSKQVVWYSDSHSFFGDPFTWLAFLDFIASSQPEVVCLGGDTNDGSMISNHDHPPGFGAPFQQENDLQRAQVREIRRLCPNARILMIPDNHWTDRIVRYMTQISSALSGVRSMRIDKLMGLEESGAEIVHRGSFLAPKGHEADVGRKTLWGQLQLTHGTKTGRFPAMAELMDWVDLGLPKGAHGLGLSGHVHRRQQVIGPNSGLRRMSWVSTHCACTDYGALYFVKGNAPAWSRGFEIVDKGAKAIQSVGVDTTSGEAFAHGWRYEAKKGLPKAPNAVKKWWLKRYKSDFLEFSNE
tara:strand:+ start:478 stop:1830 length:1353 start_codon:yes stop_codon:yes gene_type:complete